MTRADGGLDRDAKALRDTYGTPYAVARKLVRELGVEAATERCAADHAARAHTLESHVTHGLPEASPVVGGVCTVCGAVVDEVAHQDFVEGPRMVVELTESMHEFLLQTLDSSNARHVLGQARFEVIHDEPLDNDERPVAYTGRRRDITQIADWLRRLGASLSTTPHLAVIARHAAHRIESALKGARA